MLGLTHIFIVIFCTYVIFNFYVSTTVVVSPPPPPPPSPPPPFSLNFNCMSNIWYEQNHYFQRKYPSFEPLDILKPFATRFILKLLLFTLFLHLCNSVRFISFSTNLTLNRKKKDTSRLPQSVTVTSLLVRLLSAESPENYFPILIILPDLYYRLYVQFSINIS